MVIMTLPARRFGVGLCCFLRETETEEGPLLRESGYVFHLNIDSYQVSLKVVRLADGTVAQRRPKTVLSGQLPLAIN